jgi:hypothetical protein
MKAFEMHMPAKRSPAVIEADIRKLLAEIRETWENEGGDYSGPDIMAAVFEVHPEFEIRWQALCEEYKAAGS